MENLKIHQSKLFIMIFAIFLLGNANFKRSIPRPVYDVGKFDIAGLQLGMSPDDTLRILIKKFHANPDQFECRGCHVNYYDTRDPLNIHVECDANSSQFGVDDKPELHLFMDGLRVEVKFYHENAKNTGPCIAYNIWFGETGFLTERDSNRFRLRIVSRYSSPSIDSKFTEFYWCQKIE